MEIWADLNLQYVEKDHYFDRTKIISNTDALDDVYVEKNNLFIHAWAPNSECFSEMKN